MGGNLLINVGSDGTGRIPDLQQQPPAAAGSGQLNLVTEELIDYASAERGLTLLAYSPLKGDLRPSRRGHAGWLDHPTSQQRLAVLREVAAELGATPSQVVLAWLMQGRRR
jgi:aryl-alcohol dehydrogenase-like predicted oxidoreductase